MKNLMMLSAAQAAKGEFTGQITSVARLRKSGAFILGKTDRPILANCIRTNTPVFGLTNNPCDLTRSPGGSSGVAADQIATCTMGYQCPPGYVENNSSQYTGGYQ